MIKFARKIKKKERKKERIGKYDESAINSGSKSIS